jgi:hypothetical protein
VLVGLLLAACGDNAHGPADASCDQCDAADVDAADIDAAVDADTCALANTWHDFAAGDCKVCPAPGVTCADLTGTGQDAYDEVTHKLTLDLQPGLAEIVPDGSTVEFADCFGLAVIAYDDVAVDELAIVATLPPLVAAFPDCVEYRFGLTDRCGDHFSVTMSGLYDSGSKVTTLVCE